MKELKSSVKKTFAILEQFSSAKPSWGITELAHHLGSNKSTVYRFLADLEALGVVYQNPESEKYSLGLKLFELGNRVELRSAFVEKVHPELVKVSKAITETVHVAILKNKQVFYVDKVESPQGLRISSGIGTYAPSYSTSLGKVLLAFLPLDAQGFMLEELNHSGNLKAFTSNTLTDINNLRGALGKIRSQGYAIDREELEVGLICVGVPIFNQQNVLVASLSASGPANRFKEEKLADYVGILQAGARAIQAQIGNFQPS